MQFTAAYLVMSIALTWLPKPSAEQPAGLHFGEATTGTQPSLSAEEEPKGSSRDESGKRPNSFARSVNELAPAETAEAGYADAPVVGEWQGGKSERNPIRGGMINVEFSFLFTAGGEYEETVYMGGQQIMSAHGTYALRAARKADDPTVTHILSFNPEKCSFLGEEYAQQIRIVGLPNEQSTEEYVGFFRLAPGGQMTLESTTAGRMSGSWGLKRVVR